jgi:hypothetical protein
MTSAIPKPTISELEDILAQPDQRVDIAPSGEIYVRHSYDGLRGEIQTAINRNSAENGSNTPDWILAEYLIGCLKAWDDAMMERERWYGRPIEGVPLNVEG